MPATARITPSRTPTTPITSRTATTPWTPSTPISSRTATTPWTPSTPITSRTPNSPRTPSTPMTTPSTPRTPSTPTAPTAIFYFKKKMVLVKNTGSLHCGQYKLQVHNIHQAGGCSGSTQHLAYLYTFSRNDHVCGKSATRTRKEIKLREEMPLPSPEDLKLLTNYITTKAEEAYNYLTTVGFSYTHWLLLSKCVLLSIIIFNRRRVGEASQMKKEMYLKKNKISEKERSMLTRLERMRADKFSLMRLIAKRGHIVNVLLNPIQVTYIDTLLHFRCEAGVEEANEFLFATPGDNKHVDASQALRQFSDHCGAKNPASLRGTYFRKQVATMAQILSMDDNQIHQLAAAMGHSDAVHRNVYRQNEKLFQVTQLSKLLMVVGEPDFEKYRGKTLDEITSMAEQEAEGATPAVAATTRPQNTPEEATGDIMRLTPKKRTPKKQTIEDIQYQLRRTPKKRVKRPFTKTEIEIMEACFADHLETKTLATMAHCEQILQSNRETFYSSRSARDIYNWVQYQRNKTTRQHK